jgi:hypothetical protein
VGKISDINTTQKIDNAVTHKVLQSTRCDIGVELNDPISNVKNTSPPRDYQKAPITDGARHIIS